MSRNYKSKSNKSNRPVADDGTKVYRGKGKQGNSNKGDSYKADKPTNNPSWYMTNNAIVEGVAQLPFNMPIGSMFNVSEGFSAANYMDNHTPTVSAPGIAVLDVVPSFGDQRDSASALNIASQAIYTWVRYYNSGSRNYTPADLMIYLAANGQIYSMINWAMRIYGTLSYYDHRNKYLGQAIIAAMNIDYNDFIGRLAEFRGRLNLLIDKAASFVVPNTMTYFLRTASLFTDIYTDGNSIKDQLYLFNPIGFYRYTFDTSETPAHDGAYLKFHTLTADDHLMTVDDVIAFLDDSISALINSHDQGVISGDLFKAYQGNILTLTTMAENYRTQIVNDPWVLNQIKNATLTSYWDYPDLYQNPAEGTVTFDPSVRVTLAKEGATTADVMAWKMNFLGMRGDRVLTVPSEQVDTSQVMEFTRYMTIMVDPTNEQTETDYVATATFLTGTEIILRARFVFYSASSFGDQYGRLTRAFFNGYLREYNSTNMVDRVLVDSLKHYFKYFPAVLKYNVDPLGKYNFLGMDLDIDNYTLIDANELRHLHDVALMNLLATDAVAKLK